MPAGSSNRPSGSTCAGAERGRYLFFGSEVFFGFETLVGFFASFATASSSRPAIFPCSLAGEPRSSEGDSSRLPRAHSRAAIAAANSEIQKPESDRARSRMRRTSEVRSCGVRIGATEPVSSAARATEIPFSRPTDCRGEDARTSFLSPGSSAKTTRVRGRAASAARKHPRFLSAWETGVPLPSAATPWPALPALARAGPPRPARSPREMEELRASREEPAQEARRPPARHAERTRALPRDSRPPVRRARASGTSRGSAGDLHARVDCTRGGPLAPRSSARARTL